MVKLGDWVYRQPLYVKSAWNSQKKQKKGTKWLTTNESLDEMSIWEIFVGYDILPATNIGSEIGRAKKEISSSNRPSSYL